jgi:hypothetical protein
LRGLRVKQGMLVNAASSGYSSLKQGSTSSIVIASEAKQSRATKKELDCFVASLLAMTVIELPSFCS